MLLFVHLLRNYIILTLILTKNVKLI